MDRRASIPPGLPRSNPTTAYWQDPPDEHISNVRSTPEIPQTADVIIIGSGITGACVAYNILQKSPNMRVVMLEAREAVSGATGRNGGHTKTASYRSFLGNCHALGVQEAIKIARLEYNNMKAVHAFARQNNINCDLQSVDTVDVILNEQEWQNGIAAVEAMRKVMNPGEGAANYRLHDAEAAQKQFLIPDAVGAITYEAGSLSAYKLVAGILKLCLQKGLNLQTNTPVTAIEPFSGMLNGNTARSNGIDGAKHDYNTKKWTATTARGKISAPKLVLATNGYSAHLYPALQGIIVPLKGQVTAQRPGSKLPPGALPTTYSFIYQDGFEYMIPRPLGSKFAGDTVIGGGLTKAPEQGLYQWGNADDTTLDPDISEYLQDCLVNFFGRNNWGEDNPEGRVRKEWTGIMGYSADGHPLVGKVPGEEGLYLSASFQGHGMVLCFMCARALTEMILNNDGEREILDSWFPEAFRITKDRLEKEFEGFV
ncbi:FAD dependent oxidoreductase [Xylona heveae TC161]|uniref:FAD dependent oxidoreductase n=1 Tax=Xylona heveae (strain CBS 132557 / TC161) TaxID=1328760 RepID=A0A165JNC2_XYLHT|nr:FAD dependent oxidoreductase [Xylona heveae TC161]KZF26448.1 FAD dependent oxidoreductase [Xylona heveae TC161]